MTSTVPRLILVTPVVADAAAFAPRLAEACAAGEVAAVVLRLAEGDERTQVNRVKALVHGPQEHGAAVVVAVPDGADPVTVATRGGADGIHLEARAGRDPDEAFAGVRELRERLPEGRVIGAGGLASKHAAMLAGEAGVDYVMFGEPRRDGSVPPFEAVAERAAWWAEIFEIPCVAFAPGLDRVRDLAATGAEFVAVGEAIWTHPDGPGPAVKAVLAHLDPGRAV